ncbi:hypothetical protein J0A71_07g15940 [Encephalitozoon cuniculi]|nr:hypothetical protein J0A71_07g15940 [Encephalitozoon cuniculi]
MVEDERRVYMLLELEKIKELAIPHVYVFPTDALEFTCAAFKGSIYAVFRLVKTNIHEEWNALLNIGHGKEMHPIPSSQDAHVVLQAVLNALNRESSAEVFGKSQNVFPFVFRDFSNRKRNIGALLSFVKNRCFKENSNG